MSAGRSYSTLQIALHWLVAILIVGAYTTSDGMGRVLRDRIASGATGTEGNTTHVWIGGVMFLLILIRIVVRLIQGAPDAPEGTPRHLQLAALWGHRLIYVLMIATPALGAAAWYGGIRAAGEAHEIAGNTLMLIALGHAIMAIVHEVWLSDGTLARMTRPGS